MLILRALAVIVGGLAFIFLPGAVIAALTRRDLRYESTLLFWGMGVLVVTLFPALFLTSLLRIIILGEQAPDQAMLYVFGLVGSLLTAVFLEGGKYLLLRWRKIPADRLLDSGMMIGLGVGLLTNIFQGMALVGAGLRLLFGDTSMPDLAAIAAQPWIELLTGLVALNVYRVALVALGAALGALAARALITGRLRWLWLAMGINAAAAWSYAAIGLALGSDSLIGSVVVIVYQGIVAALALRWLVGQIAAHRANAPGEPESKKRRAAAAKT